MVYSQVYFPVFNIILGFALLFFGQKLFWLFVGLVGFLAGFGAAEYYYEGESEWVILLAGIFSGFLGILLATFLEKIALALIGAFAGGFLGVDSYLTFFNGSDTIIAPVFITGALIGGITFLYFFNWTLILFSALLGSILIIQPLKPEHNTEIWLFLVLFITGIIVQIRAFKDTKAEKTV